MFRTSELHSPDRDISRQLIETEAEKQGYVNWLQTSPEQAAAADMSQNDFSVAPEAIAKEGSSHK